MGSDGASGNFTALEDELEVTSLVFKVHEEGKDSRLWDLVASDATDNGTVEPLRLSLRMKGGVGTLIAGAPDADCPPEGFSWQVRSVPLRDEKAAKHVEKWSGLRLRRKDPPNNETYGTKPDDELTRRRKEREKEQRKQENLKTKLGKSKAIRTLKGMFGRSKPGDYDDLSVLEDPISFTYANSDKQNHHATALKNKQVLQAMHQSEGMGPFGPGTHQSEGMGPSGPGTHQSGPGMGPWEPGMDYSGLGMVQWGPGVCHPDCTLLGRGTHEVGKVRDSQIISGKQICEEKDSEICVFRRKRQRKYVRYVLQEVSSTGEPCKHKPWKTCRKRRGSKSTESASEEENMHTTESSRCSSADLLTHRGRQGSGECSDSVCRRHFNKYYRKPNRLECKCAHPRRKAPKRSRKKKKHVEDVPNTTSAYHKDCVHKKARPYKDPTRIRCS